MHYDLKRSSNKILLWAMDVLIIRKAEYMNFLEQIENENKIPEMKFIHESIWYENGVTLTDFDDDIERIQFELDEDYRYN